MCEFFSFTTKGDGVPMYFNAKIRKQISEGKISYSPNSHTSINDYFGLKGAKEDKTNKYEYILGNPHRFVIDQINVPDDSEKCRKWVSKFIRSKKYTAILGTLESLYLRGCDIKGITLPTTVGGYLDLRGCDLKGITLPTTVGGYLDLRGCDLKGITLPTTIGGSLYLRGCDLKEVNELRKIYSNIIY
jgi:hypothetical protein